MDRYTSKSRSKQQSNDIKIQKFIQKIHNQKQKFKIKKINHKKYFNEQYETFDLENIFENMRKSSSKSIDRTSNQSEIFGGDKSINLIKEMKLSHIQIWKSNQVINPMTKNKFKKVSFYDTTTDYFELYFTAFNLLWKSKYTNLKTHLINMKEDIEFLKNRLPNIHCYHIDEKNNNNINDFDYLFFYSYLQTLKRHRIHLFTIRKNLHYYLKYVDIYMIIFKNPNLFVKKIQNDRKDIEKYLNNIIQEFLFDFARFNMNQIRSIAIWKNNPNVNVLYQIQSKLQTLKDLHYFNSDLTISGKNLKRITNLINTTIIDISKNLQVEIDIVDNLSSFNFSSFILNTSEDLIDIAKYNIHNIEINNEYLTNEDYELNEPIKPILIVQEKPEMYPTIEMITKKYMDSTKSPNQEELSEIQDIFNEKKQRWEYSMKQYNEYESKKNEHESKMKEYYQSKSVYDEKIQKSKNKHNSPIRYGKVTMIPPYNNMTRQELIEEFVGNTPDKCKLQEDGSLPPVFSIDSTPLHDYPLSKLQLVVKIQTKYEIEEDGKTVTKMRTDCGNPIELYNYIVNYYNEGNDPINPYTRMPFTKDNINAIMKSLPFALKKPKIKTPKKIIKQYDKNLAISFTLYDNFYVVFLYRSFDNFDIPIYNICCFPSDIGDENSIDRTSTGMAYILDNLFTERKLLHTYMSPFAIFQNNGYSVIKKSFELLKYKMPGDWPNDEVEKKEVFYKLYQNLELVS